MLAATAAAQARGQITAEHVEVIRKSIAKLPGFVDACTREQFEADLVRTAVGVGPKEVGDVAELTLFLLDQDGPAPDDTERDRKRGFHQGRQRRRRNGPVQRRLHPGSVGGVGGDLRQVRRPRHVQPRRSRTLHLRHPDPRPRSTTITAAWPNANTTR